MAELTAATDAISAYRQRVADLAPPHVGQERDDLVTAIYEAERALRVAERTLQRALRLAEALTRRTRCRKAATAPGGRGRRSGDARRRIPAVATNQVAGTWLRNHHTTGRLRGKGPPRQRRDRRRCRGNVLDGQMSSSEHSAHRGVRARQTRRPWRIIRRLKSPRSLGGR